VDFTYSERRIEMEKVSKITVERTSGEEIILKLWFVDRKWQRVGFEIIEYNARLIFTKTRNWIGIFSESDRRLINPGEEAILHVSKTVYKAMVRWAGSILNDRREEKGG